MSRCLWRTNWEGQGGGGARCPHILNSLSVFNGKCRGKSWLLRMRDKPKIRAWLILNVKEKFRLDQSLQQNLWMLSSPLSDLQGLGHKLNDIRSVRYDYSDLCVRTKAHILTVYMNSPTCFCDKWPTSRCHLYQGIQNEYIQFIYTVLKTHTVWTIADTWILLKNVSASHYLQYPY
jgi:hypothetical protein